MDFSSTVATGLYLATTILGRGFIATQFGTAIDQAGPFHFLGGIGHLGIDNLNSHTIDLRSRLLSGQLSVQTC
jgi:hypothetical protein